MPKTKKGFTLMNRASERSERGFTLMKAKRTEGFTLIELLVVIAILGILVTLGLGSYMSAQIKSRDAKRKANLSQIAQSLELYNNDKGKYPLGSSGQIYGCGAGGISVCSWGTSVFSDTTTGTIYMVKLPTDPAAYSYYYVSNGKNYQLYAHLENERDSGVLSTITYTTQCGDECNYGIASTNSTP